MPHDFHAFNFTDDILAQSTISYLSDYTAPRKTFAIGSSTSAV